MIQRRLRPQTDDERVTAENYIAYLQCEIAGRRSPARLVNGTVIGILLGLIVAAIVAGTLQRAGIPEIVWKLALLFLATAGAVLGLRIAERQRRAEQEPFLSLLPYWNRVCDEGVMEEWEVTASGCVRVGEGTEPAYFFDIGEGKVLFLLGWYMADAVDEERFPCPVFTLSRFPGITGEAHELICAGDLLVPLHTLGYESLPAGYLPGDGEVRAAGLRTLEEDLRHLTDGGCDMS